MSLMSPFLCSIIILVSFHSAGIFLSLRSDLKKIVICFTDSSPPSFMISLVRLSMPGALLFFISFRVFLTSDVMIGGTSDESELVIFSGGRGGGGRRGCWSWGVELYSSV